MEKYEIKYEIGNLNNDETVYTYEVDAIDELDAKNKFFDAIFRDKKLQDKLLFITTVTKLEEDSGVTQTSGIVGPTSVFGDKGSEVDEIYKELLSIDDYE